MLSAASTLASGLILLGSVDAFFRINCANIQRGRIDPLVNPGAIAAHSHTIVGGSNIGVNATHDSLVQSSCTSCEVQADKSAYWSPTLYYRYTNGSFFEVPHNGAVVYYLGRGPGKDKTVPFPKGMMILSGDKSARSYDKSTMTYGTAQYPGRPVADRVSFNCLDVVTNPETPGFNKTSCINGLRAQIHFQSCWNGKDLYKADNSHVAYQSQIDDGICPPTHPLQIPHIFLEVHYDVALVPDQNGGQFVFSQGDPTGYGFHADFQNGWDMAIQANITKDCLNTDNFGQISACPAIFATDSNAYQFNCPERPPQIGEPVQGLIAKLPGCITITPGPAAAPAASMNCPPGSPQPVVTRTVDSTPQRTNLPTVGQNFGLANQKYLGCYNDTGGNDRTLNAYSYSNYSVMTVDFCQNLCNSRGYRFSGVEYAQECHCDNSILPAATTGQPINSCTWDCGGTVTSGATREICGGYGFISIYNNTSPTFVADGSSVGNGGTAAPVTALGAIPANYVGCYSDSNARTLDGPTLTANNMTAAVCATFCAQGAGYAYYGTEYSTQCYCGNALAMSGSLYSPTTSPSNTTACSIRCAGKNEELCGGNNALSVYKNPKFKAPAIKNPVGKYASKGCLTDPNTSGRALAGAATTNAAMTAEMCVKFCLGKSMNYAGVEYGTECYCGKSINTASGGKTGTCPISSMKTCPGDGTEYCGGASLMVLYYSSTT